MAVSQCPSPQRPSDSLASASATPPLSETACLIGLLDALPHAVAIFDLHLFCVHTNAAFAQITGLRIASHGGRSLATLLPGAAAQLEKSIRRSLVDGATILDQPLDEPLKARDAKGSHRWLLSVKPLEEQTPDGLIAGVIVQLRDAKHDTGQAIRAVETQSRRLLDNLFTFVGLLTPDGTVVDANRAPLEAGGISIEDVRGKKLWETYWFCHDPYLQARLQLSVEAAMHGEVLRYDMLVRMKDDTRMSVDFMLAPLRNDAGEITHLVPSAIDISDRKRSEAALRQSEEQFRCVVEAAPDGLAMIDHEGRLTLVNSSTEKMFGYPREELLGQPIEMLMPERCRGTYPDLRSAYMNAPTSRDMAGRRELYAMRKDGSEFPVEIGLIALSTAGGEHVLAAISDVTQRKADQGILENALSEKTVLLNEVHHRVKNNLQVVCSLLSLQARTAKPEARVMLEDSQARVKTMALLHQLLYERSDFSRVELGQYLRRLGSLLRELLGEARSRVTLQIETGDSDIQMDLQRSVPCGLLINELVTNAIKHAFPGGRHGKILVHAELVSPALARIVVSDDGIGVPPDLQLGAMPSLGFQLIPLFVDQLGGDLRLIRENGSRFELYFKPGLGRD
ncbi:MAG: signal transduction histidine kinase [Rhodocyclales bacterium]|nr:signal transduction histidine kinase [Rhodocyclales bacterium]